MQVHHRESLPEGEGMPRHSLVGRLRADGVGHRPLRRSRRLQYERGGHTLRRIQRLLLVGGPSLPPRGGEVSDSLRPGEREPSDQPLGRAALRASEYHNHHGEDGKSKTDCAHRHLLPLLQRRISGVGEGAPGDLRVGPCPECGSPLCLRLRRDGVLFPENRDPRRRTGPLPRLRLRRLPDRAFRSGRSRTRSGPVHERARLHPRAAGALCLSPAGAG